MRSLLPTTSLGRAGYFGAALVLISIWVPNYNLSARLGMTGIVVLVAVLALWLGRALYEMERE